METKQQIENPPAFPFEYNGVDGFGDPSRRVEPGITMRDYFAAKAMQGICAHTDTWGLRIPEVADKAYEMADAMLVARAKSEPK